MNMERNSSVEAAGEDSAAVNHVHLVGRLSSTPVDRELPSGDHLVSFRLVVRRPPGHGRSRVTVDALECHSWEPEVLESAATWQIRDVIEVEGTLRRRFFRTSQGTTQSMTEVEVLSGQKRPPPAAE